MIRRFPKEGPWMNKSFISYPSKLIIIGFSALDYFLLFFIILLSAKIRREFEDFIPD